LIALRRTRRSAV